MNQNLDKNAVAKIVLQSYGHPECSFWDFDQAQVNSDAGDGLGSFILSETSEAHYCPTTLGTLSEVIRLMETVVRDTRSTLVNLNAYAVHALAASYVEHFVALERPAAEFFENVSAWRKNQRGSIDAAFGHTVLPTLKEVWDSVENEAKDVNPDDRPKLVLKALRARLMINTDYLPEGVTQEPLYDCAEFLTKPTATDGASPCPANGQAVAA